MVDSSSMQAPGGDTFASWIIGLSTHLSSALRGIDSSLPLSSGIYLVRLYYIFVSCSTTDIYSRSVQRNIIIALRPG
jgi:hypothetical protein